MKKTYSSSILSALLPLLLITSACTKPEETPLQPEEVQRRPAYKDTILESLLSPHDPDYGYVAEFLPKYFDTVKSLVSESNATSLQPLITEAQNHAVNLSKLAKPHAAT